MKKKLAIVTTHPIQYYAPIFKLLTERNKISIKVFYTWSQAKDTIFDPGFRRNRKWDIPLLEGYDFTFVNNIAKNPGSHHFKGLKNPDLIKEIESWKPNAILLFGWSFHSHLNCLRHFKNKIPIFFRGDSTLLNETIGLKKIARRLFLTFIYKHVEKAFYVGENNKAYYLKHGMKESQLIRAPHAIDNNRFSIEENKLEEKIALIKKELKIDDDDFVILFAGKIEYVKNPFYIIDLADKIKDKKIKFLIVGNGKLENDIKERAKSDKRIKFLDFQNQSHMPLIYRLGTIFILPSISETWGLAANEAMACGLPVLLSTKVGGAIDLVKENGMVYNSSEIDKVVSFIFSLKNDKKKLSAAKAASLERIKFFNFEVIAEAIEKELL